MKFPKRRIEIKYGDITLEEAIYRMSHHDGERWCDANRQMVVMVE